MRTKRIFLIFLVLCLSICMFAIPAAAATKASGTWGTNLTWTLTADGVLTISGKGPMDTGPWSDELETFEFPWTRLKDSVTRLVVKNGVTTIAQKSFSEFANLTTVSLPDTLEQIGTASFARTGLVSVEVPDSVMWLGMSAFYECPNLTYAKLPANLQLAAEGVFGGCENLTTIVMPQMKDLEYLSYGCFSSCHALTDLDWYTADRIYPNLFSFSSGLVDVTIPSNVQALDSWAMAYCQNLKSIVIPASVKQMLSGVLSGCDSLTEIHFLGDAPSNVYDGDVYESLDGVTATAYYPADNKTWTAAVRASYGGNITWVETHIHQYDAAVTKPTCTNDGYTTYTCACGDSYIDNRTSPVAHTYVNGLCKYCNDPQISHETTVVQASSITSSGKNQISWNAVAGAVKYELWRTASKSGTFTRLTTTSNTSYTHTGGKAGSTYYYYIIAVDANGNKSEQSNVVNRTCDLAQPVISLSNDASSGKIKVSWEDVEGAVEYQVYRATSKTGKYTLVKTTTGNSYTNTSATAGKAYYYKVKAIAEKSAANSAYSEVQSRTCDLAQPEITLSNVASSGKIKVSWEKIDGAVSYKVYRATSKAGSYKLLKTTTDTSCTNTSVDAGKTYYYKVIAVHDNEKASSAYSKIKYRTADLPQPEVSIALSSGKPKVSWKAVEGATEYKVYRATSKTGTYSLVKTTTNLSFKNTSAVKNKTYYYKVIAVCSNTAGNSAYSKAVSIKATK